MEPLAWVTSVVIPIIVVTWLCCLAYCVFKHLAAHEAAKVLGMVLLTDVKNMLRTH